MKYNFVQGKNDSIIAQRRVGDFRYSSARLDNPLNEFKGVFARPGEYPIKEGKLPDVFLKFKEAYSSAQWVIENARQAGYKVLKIESLPYGESESGANRTNLGSIPSAKAYLASMGNG